MRPKSCFFQVKTTMLFLLSYLFFIPASFAQFINQNWVVLPKNTTPVGLVIDKDGNIYTANKGTSSVSKLMKDGSFIPAWAQLGTYAHMMGIAIDHLGNIYTANANDNSISKITKEGGLTEKWVLLAKNSFPMALTIDQQGTLYTINGNQTISKITPSGGVTHNWATFPGWIEGAVIDAAGNVYVSSPDSDEIHKITSSGSITLGWALLENGAYPMGLGIDADGNIYTGNVGIQGVSKITSGGNVTAKWASMAADTGPYRLVADKMGNVFTSNWNNSVSKITKGGILTQNWAKFVGFIDNSEIAINEQGFVFTVNTGNSTVSKIGEIALPTHKTELIYDQPAGKGFQHYISNQNQMIATVTTPASGGANGSTTATVWIDAAQKPQYVKRHYQITPAINGTGTVTLYFTQQDFDDYNATNPIKKLPINAADQNKQNLVIRKFDGASNDPLSGDAATYSGGAVNIVPSSVIWNAVTNQWEVTFDVTSFSGFFATTDPVFLPAVFNTLSAEIKNNQLLVNWNTFTETNNQHFDIEASTDGLHFKKIGTVISKAPNGSTTEPLAYSFGMDLEKALATGSVLSIMLLGWASWKRRPRLQLLCLLGLGAFILFHSCTKQGNGVAHTKAEKMFIRIAQVNKAGEKNYSKVIRVIQE